MLSRENITGVPQGRNANIVVVVVIVVVDVGASRAGATNNHEGPVPMSIRYTRDRNNLFVAPTP